MLASIYRTGIFIFILIFVNTSCSCKRKDDSLKLNNPRNIKGVTSYKRTFGDKNDLHLAAARQLGVPIVSSREDAESMKDKLSPIFTDKYYTVDSLTHSIPYLVPRAKTLLSKIGSNFLDSLEAKGLNPNHVIVTSVLRTQDDVKKLRRRNVNASENSAHCHGTTFDISYKRFQKIEKDRPMQDVAADTLKLVLAEVLRDLKNEEQCYVKYELKQACFHITAR